MVRPSTASMKNSGTPKAKITGMMIGRETASKMAPRTPPNADTV